MALKVNCACGHKKDLIFYGLGLSLFLWMDVINHYSWVGSNALSHNEAFDLHNLPNN